jgi:maltose alpha-D-glucosyltransferase/alpha-amylase
MLTFISGFQPITIYSEAKKNDPVLKEKEAATVFFDKEGKGTVSRFLEGYFDHYKDTVGNGYISIPVGNHDLPRINIDRDDKDLEQITAFLLTFPGPPFIYYGEEIGMKHLPDVPNREGAYSPRKGARTPMRWNDEKNAGFSSAYEKNIYLPIDEDEDRPTVEKAEAVYDSLLHKTRKLIKIRTNEKALEADVGIEILFGEENTYPFIFSREKNEEKILCIFNPGRQAVEVTFDCSLTSDNLTLLSGKEMKIEFCDKKVTLVAPGCSYAIYKKTND